MIAYRALVELQGQWPRQQMDQEDLRVRVVFPKRAMYCYEQYFPKV